MNKEPIKGGEYTCINGDIYKVLEIADYTEEQMRLVVYTTDRTDGVYACPVDVFNSNIRDDNIQNEETKKEDGDEAGQSGIDPLLERFLDADSYEKKLECFYLMKNKADLKMLNNVAMSLDIEVTKETVEEQYAEILYCLKTMEKYECNRLRP